MRRYARKWEGQTRNYGLGAMTDLGDCGGRGAP